MRLLLDSHIVAWCITDRRRLGAIWTSIISDPANSIYMSAAVTWEFRVKQNLGKFHPTEQFWEELRRLEFEEVPIRSQHAHAVNELTNIHKDPFDRMMLAQAKVERLQFVTADKVLAGYGDFVSLV